MFLLKVYTDAAVSGHPGQAAVGVLASGSGHHLQWSQALEGLWDNHSAEFEAIVLALTKLIDLNLNEQVIFIYSDSQVAVDLLQKGHSKNPKFQPYLDQIYDLEKSFHYLSIDWLSSSQNRKADQLARQALHRARQPH